MKIIAYPLVAALLIAVSSAFFPAANISAQSSARNIATDSVPVLDPGNISYANAWRIMLNNQAESDGEIIFRIIRKENASYATRVSITIEKGTAKADLAKIIEDALKSAAPAGIKVDRNINDEISLTNTTGICLLLDRNNIADLSIAILKE